MLSGDYVSKYSEKEVARLHRILDTDYVPAQFDDALEIGKKENEKGMEYFIFNRKAHIKKYEICVPNGEEVTDLFENKPMTVTNGKVTVYLTKNGCAWIGVQKTKKIS